MAENMYYQPTLTREELDLLVSRRFEGLRRSMENRQQQSGDETARICVDRLVLILENLPGPVSGYSILDLGCASGFFTNSLALLGSSWVIGIDNNTHVRTFSLNLDDFLIRARQDASRFGVEKSVQYIEEDLVSIMRTPRPELKSDVVLCLSVFHHLFLGYGFLPHKKAEVLGARALPVMKWLDSHTGEFLFFEIHESVFEDWSHETIAERILEQTSFEDVKLIGDTRSYESTPRGLWLCSR